jgi:hypothetical protein
MVHAHQLCQRILSETGGSALPGDLLGEEVKQEPGSLQLARILHTNVFVQTFKEET